MLSHKLQKSNRNYLSDFNATSPQCADANIGILKCWPVSWGKVETSAMQSAGGKVTLYLISAMGPNGVAANSTQKRMLVDDRVFLYDVDGHLNCVGYDQEVLLDRTSLISRKSLICYSAVSSSSHGL